MTQPWSDSDVPPGARPGVPPQGRPEVLPGLPAQRPPDVLPAATPPGRRRVRGVVLTGLAGVAAAAVAGTAWATASFLSGGGAQPEDVLPAEVFAVAKIDLDPAAGQKLAAYRLAKKFPATADEVSSEDEIKDELLRAVFEDAGSPDVDYARDVEPWVGDRAAIAALPGDGAEPEVIAAVAFTDRAKAEQSLPRLAGDSGDTFWAFSTAADYVLIGQSQATVDAAAAADDVLADSSAYSDAVDALDGDQIVTAWADLDALWSSLPEEARQTAVDQGLELGGRVVVGAHASSDAVEVVGRSFDLVTGPRTAAGIGAEPGLDLVQGLPADVVGAVGVTGLGDGFADLYTTVLESEGAPDLQAEAAELGLDMPQDLRVLLGQQTVGAAFGPDDMAVRSRTDDPERAAVVVEKVVELLGGTLFGLFGAGLYAEEYSAEAVPLEPYGEEGFGTEGFGGEGFGGGAYPAEPAPVPGTTGEYLLEPPVAPDGTVEGYGEEHAEQYAEQYGEGHLEEGEWVEAEPLTDGSVGFPAPELPADQMRVLEDGLAVGTSATAVDRISGDGGGLGDAPMFREAVPDAEDAGFLLFVDIQRAFELSGDGAMMSPEDAANIEPLEAFGLTWQGSENGSFRMRLTVR